MKLIVQYPHNKKRNTAFHPTLKIRDTGYALNHWQEQHFREGLFTGAKTVQEKNVEQAIAEYFADLRRMGYVAVKVTETVLESEA